MGEGHQDQYEHVKRDKSYHDAKLKTNLIETKSEKTPILSYFVDAGMASGFSLETQR